MKMGRSTHDPSPPVVRPSPDVIDVVTCPLCNDAFDGGVAYRAHLEDAHGLRDDEGTATVVPEPTPDDDHLSLMAEALLDDRPAADPTPTAESATTPHRGEAEPVTWPERPSSGRYELATRYGDVALYAPGLLMLLTSVVRLEADVIGFVLLVVGVALIVLGMLLPVVHGRR